MTKIIIVILLLSFFNTSTAQLILSGKVLNKENGRPIAYANIGIAKKNLGTLCNPDGTFAIALPFTSNDTLQISALGFERVAIPISSIVKNIEMTILLAEQPLQLKTVVVTDRKQKNKTFELGNSSFNGGVLETDTAYAGGSTALLIENAGADYQEDLEFPVYVEKAKLRIFKNNLKTLKFRIKLNEVDPHTGAPGADLLDKSIVVESDMRKGWLEFDLSHFNLVVTGPFFLTFEQILDVTDRTAIADGYREFMLAHSEKLKIDTVEFEGRKEIRKSLSGSAIDLPGTFISIANADGRGKNRTCYTRETSFGEWTKVRGIVTATVTLSNQSRERNRNDKILE